MNNEQDTEVIESTVEAVEESVDESAVEASEVEENSSHEQAVQNKKSGGFFSFLTFLIACSALALSGYQYYQAFFAQKQSANTDNQWQAPLEKLQQQLQQTQNKLQNEVKQHKSNLLVQFQEVNNKQAQVDKELKSLQSALADAKAQPQSASNDSAQNTANLNQEFEKRFSELSQKLNQQNQQISQLNQQLKQAQQNTAKSLEQLNDSVSKPLALAQTLPELEVNYELIRAENYVQMASMQLQIQTNKVQAIDSLRQAVAELESLSGQNYQNLAFEISQTIKLIEQVKTVNTAETLKQIDAVQTQALELKQQKAVEPEEKTSWLENLVVVRKVDDTQKIKLSATERLVLNNRFKAHFDLLRLALYGKNQQQWNENLTELSDLIAANFPHSGGKVVAVLKPLQELSFQADFPSLSSLMESLSKLKQGS